MIRQFLPHRKQSGVGAASNARRKRLSGPVLLGAAALLFAAIPAAAQVVINSKTGVVTNDGTTSTIAGTVDRRYQQITPTSVELSKSPLDPKTRQDVIRTMQAEQGFAMRPFPRGHKGLLLNANGKLDPAGEQYLNMVTAQGLSAKPGDRLVITDVKIEHSHLVFDLNGGPDKKHRFLRHVQIGAGPTMNPVAQDNDEDPVGARLTLAFKGTVPELTGKEIKSLLAPLISFDVKTPIQAFTDTLPPSLKKAILDHHVLVGMSTDMVLFALGQPDSKTREMEGQMPFEEWIYGKPPKEVQFVRINGNRVIRVELAKVGLPPVISTQDQVEGMMRTDGTPLDPALSKTRTIEVGDVERNPDTQAPVAPPSLRQPGETLPQVDQGDTDKGRVGVMKPVQFPKSKSQEDSSGQQDGAQPAAASTGGAGQKPDSGAPPVGTTPPADATPSQGSAPQDPPAKPQYFVPAASAY